MIYISLLFKVCIGKTVADCNICGDDGDGDVNVSSQKLLCSSISA